MNPPKINVPPPINKGPAMPPPGPKPGIPPVAPPMPPAAGAPHPPMSARAGEIPPGGMMVPNNPMAAHPPGHAVAGHAGREPMVTIQIPHSQFEMMKQMVTNLAQIMHLGSAKANADISAASHGQVPHPPMAVPPGLMPPSGGPSGAPPTANVAGGVNPQIANLAAQLGFTG